MLEAGKKRQMTCSNLLNNLPAVSSNDKGSNITMTSPSILKLPGRFRPGRLLESELAPRTGYRSHHSRWREDWEELEHLGEGGFGRVGMISSACTSNTLETYGCYSVKARNRLDGRIYAVWLIVIIPR
jgi:eukaryotic translation initiation factor 2-alpha kinase 4